MVRILTVGIAGPLEQYAAGFAEFLDEQGFAPLSAANQLRVFAHLSRWLVRHGLGPSGFTEARARSFVAARRRSGYTCWRSRRGLDPIVEFLRHEAAAPCAPVVEHRGALERRVAAYEHYLATERGLSPTTIERLSAVARRFLDRFGATRAALRSVSSTHIRGFLHDAAAVYAPSSLAGLSSDLRSLFRFLMATGIAQRSLAEAVPSAPGWHQRAIPMGLASSDVEKLLRSCDRRTETGQRDYAVILLLARLGLRAGEVLALTLDDIDWRHAEIVVHGKASKRARLPLPDDVGRALSAYLVSRAQVVERRIFLRSRAPYRALQKVGGIVFAASRRAGLPPVWPHRLRRTAATTMLRRGASLAEIAEVLRHSVTQTTAIYAKVDRRALRVLARPWPGVSS